MGSTDSEILEPIEEKKLLNSLAINKGSVQRVLLISSSVIGVSLTGERVGMRPN